MTTILDHEVAIIGVKISQLRELKRDALAHRIRRVLDDASGSEVARGSEIAAGVSSAA